MLRHLCCGHAPIVSMTHLIPGALSVRLLIEFVHYLGALGLESVWLQPCLFLCPSMLLCPLVHCVLVVAVRDAAVFFCAAASCPSPSRTFARTLSSPVIACSESGLQIGDMIYHLEPDSISCLHQLPPSATAEMQWMTSQGTILVCRRVVVTMYRVHGPTCAQHRLELIKHGRGLLGRNRRLARGAGEDLLGVVLHHGLDEPLGVQLLDGGARQAAINAHAVRQDRLQGAGKGRGGGKL